ncbi:hypothetical protein [uncultured Gammaproteobacteria bacterium]|nr:hypothetical protein [uncultured Gammaproteobacteria bacterium]
MTILRFIQISLPLPLLKPMGQLRRGVTQTEEDQMRLLVMVIPRFIQL